MNFSVELVVHVTANLQVMMESAEFPVRIHKMIGKRLTANAGVGNEFSAGKSRPNKLRAARNNRRYMDPMKFCRCVLAIFDNGLKSTRIRNDLQTKCFPPLSLTTP